MKTRILILVMAISFIGNAQGDLQFNQVLTYTVNTSQSNIYIVPDGKVAKIVKAVENGSSNQYYGKFTINGTNHKQNVNYDQISGAWLKAGDIIGSDVGTIYNDYILLSIIEYNIVSE